MQSPKLELLIESIKQTFPDVWAIYLFGSFAKEQANQQSDIDLAIVGPVKFDTEQRWDLQQTLSIKAGREVDLVDLRATPLVTRNEMLAAAKCIAKYDALAADLYEAHTLSDYVTFNEEVRMPIINEIRERGSIYGK